MPVPTHCSHCFTVGLSGVEEAFLYWALPVSIRNETKGLQSMLQIDTQIKRYIALKVGRDLRRRAAASCTLHAGWHLLLRCLL